MQVLQTNLYGWTLYGESSLRSDWDRNSGIYGREATRESQLENSY
jgi:hypothetical protein